MYASRVLQSQELRFRAISPSAGLALLIGIGGAFAQSGNQAAQDQGKARRRQSGRRHQGQSAQDRRIRRGPAGHQRPGRKPGMRLARPPRGEPDVAGRPRYRLPPSRPLRPVRLPGGHVQATFRCLTRFGGQIDDKVPRSLSDRIQACWINPAPSRRPPLRHPRSRAVRDRRQCLARTGRFTFAGARSSGTGGASEIAAGSNRPERSELFVV